MENGLHQRLPQKNRRPPSEHRLSTSPHMSLELPHRDLVTSDRSMPVERPFQERVDRHGQWRPKQHLELEATSSRAVVPPELIVSPQILRRSANTEPQVNHPTMETIMENLHEATRQYLRCSDLVEAAARR
ncbi:hypothetical protein F2Q69_00003638 [Brassica cretica]|uniref:Uncharacterized protein n=1 Tax=Brassica cretica TaxID=69181 RepID=A0A8S9P6H9_BRACR|nr:hypothetical protein F2Q69_00003638 [Brassica cretica]